MNSPTVADGKGFVDEPVRGPKRKTEFEPPADGGFERGKLSVAGHWAGGRDDGAADLSVGVNFSPREVRSACSVSVRIKHPHRTFAHSFRRVVVDRNRS